MKKFAIVMSLVALSIASWALFSFTAIDNDKIEVTIFAEKPSTFDLHMYKEGKYLKALTTPYTFTVDDIVAHYIIKSADPNSELKMEVKRNGKTNLTASWSLIVLLRNNSVLTTFGLNLNE